MANRARRTRVDISSLVEGLGRLGAARQSVARHMGYSMGVEVRDEARIRAPVGTEMGGSITPGLLRSAIYVAYDDQRTVLNPYSVRYAVSWNRKKAPHGHLLEFGHWMPYQYATDGKGNFWTPKPLQPQKNGAFWVMQRPFLGPAFDAKVNVLMSVAAAAGAEKFQEVMS